MKKIGFYIETPAEKELSVYQSIYIFYNGEDKCLASIGGGGDCFLRIGCAYVGLSFDAKSGRIGEVSDLLGELKKIKRRCLSKPRNYTEKILCVKSGETFVPGAVYNINIDSIILYDSANNILQLGQFNPNLVAYKFLKNAYAQLTDDGQLIGILLTDISDEKIYQ